MKVKTVDEFPPLIRGGAARNQEENKQICDLLSQVGVKHMVEDIPSKKEYSSLQQRIRSAANKLGLKVKIQWSESENAIYFISSSNTEIIEPVKVEVPENTKTEAKTSSKK